MVRKWADAEGKSGQGGDMQTVVANGHEVSVEMPCTVQQFLERQGLLPRSVVVEHNGEAVAPSEFSERPVRAGDRLEIVRIVAGG
jgi:thiamine biosynthesis protein ThiS